MEMEEAGVDVISDGEMRRFNFLVSFYDYIHGVEKIPWERQLGYPGPDMINAFRAVDQFSIPNGMGLVEELRYARTRTQKPLVTPLGGPVTFAFRIDPAEVYKDKREAAWALVPLLNQELKKVVAAGATHIQVDEPSAIDDFVSVDEFVEMLNAMVEGVKATIGLHICFGNFLGRPAVAHRTYEHVAPIFPKLHADILHLEFANRGMWQSDIFAKYARDDQFLAAGVIDVKARAVEKPEIVAERIREHPEIQRSAARLDFCRLRFQHDRPLGRARETQGDGGRDENRPARIRRGVEAYGDQIRTLSRHRARTAPRRPRHHRRFVANAGRRRH